MRWPVGTSRMPISVATLAAASTNCMSRNSEAPLPSWMRVSIRFARNGPRKLFEVREKSTRMLNSANDIAIRRVRTPAMRAA